MLPDELSSGTGIRYYTSMDAPEGVVTQDFEAFKALIAGHLEEGIYTHAAGLYMLGLVRVTPDNADNISALVAEYVSSDLLAGAGLGLKAEVSEFTRNSLTTDDRRSYVVGSTVGHTGSQACGVLVRPDGNISAQDCEAGTHLRASHGRNPRASARGGCQKTVLLALELDSEKIWDLQVFRRDDVDQRIEDLVSDACCSLPLWFDLTRERKLVHASLEADAQKIRDQIGVVVALRPPKHKAEVRMAWAYGAFFVSALAVVFWHGSLWHPVFWLFCAVSVSVVVTTVMAIVTGQKHESAQFWLSYKRKQFQDTSLSIATAQYGDKIVWASASDTNIAGWFHVLEPESRSSDFNEVLKDYLETIHVTWEI